MSAQTLPAPHCLAFSGAGRTPGLPEVNLGSNPRFLILCWSPLTMLSAPGGHFIVPQMRNVFYYDCYYFSPIGLTWWGEEGQLRCCVRRHVHAFIGLAHFESRPGIRMESKALLCRGSLTGRRALSAFCSSLSQRRSQNIPSLFLLSLFFPSLV